MKLRRSRASKRGRIEIIPMIDVMFFLLATFMLASLAMQRLDAVRLDLPRGAAQPLVEQQPLTLGVTRDGQIQINRQSVSLDQVAASIKPLLGADGNVIVAADAGAPNGVVVEAMLQARQGGAAHFLIAVQRDHP
ncbi:ExbD/TolR family protein [Burkholderia multivorans]|uniref:Biopolymer transporter ExbD n=1 Tax=Burkholderia multivorans TaxID=87883 RepID=A0AB37APD8_9BURK|nr:biopolymer transporter ExbD [Burkholderia multivorans]PRE45459.1 biopolymer transporter ExbD [Burkholderia multivorans]PRE52147.1 biopolymer transporter ExbD [Burkholderia multivorans]